MRASWCPAVITSVNLSRSAQLISRISTLWGAPILAGFVSRMTFVRPLLIRIITRPNAVSERQHSQLKRRELLQQFNAKLDSCPMMLQMLFETIFHCIIGYRSQQIRFAIFPILSRVFLEKIINSQVIWRCRKWHHYTLRGKRRPGAVCNVPRWITGGTSVVLEETLC